jgi:integrase
MHKKLTQNAISRLHNDTLKDVFLRDTDLQGFGVKITPKGKIVFLAEGRIKGGKSKRVTLGSYPQLNVDEAKIKARKALTLLRDGIDPIQQDKTERKLREREIAKNEALSVSLEELIESFFESRQLKSEKGYRSVLNSCVGDWFKLPVRDISRQMIEARYKKLAFKNNHKPQAAKAMRYLSSILNYGRAEIIEGEPLIQENPVDTLKEKRIDRTIKPKERYIEKADLFIFIRAIITECHETARDILLMQLFTGLRDSEVKKLEWRDCDFRKKTITIGVNKSDRTHIIPMGCFLYAMLCIRRFKTSSPFVFPSSDGSSYIRDIRKQNIKVTKKSGIEFSHHDLRRTFATLLEAELNVTDNVIGRLLNHSPKSVTEKHYIKSSANRYTKEANDLYKLICADHDWSTDDGEKTGEADFWSRVTGKDKEEYEYEFEGKFRQTLMMVLFDDGFQQLMKSESDIDLQYIDEEMSVYTYLPWAFMERGNQWRKRVLGTYTKTEN